MNFKQFLTISLLVSLVVIAQSDDAAKVNWFLFSYFFILNGILKVENK